MTTRIRALWFAALVAVVALRLALIIFVVPTIHIQWFVPFFQSMISNPSLDPWQTYLQEGGDPQAFPYGPVMIAFYGLTSALTAWMPEPWGVQLGLVLGSLLLEAALWVVAAKFVMGGRAKVIGILALSPVLVFATYVHGQLDLLPTLLMFLSAFFMSRKRWFASGLIVGLAVAAKFSSLLLPPLVIIFLLRNPRFRAYLRPYLLGLAPGVLLTMAPMVLPGYRAMVVETPTAQSVFAYVATLGPGLSIVVLPIVYGAILVLQYRYKRANPDIVVLLIGIALTAVTLLTPASPGWYLWSVPFLAVLASALSRRATVLVVAFWATATVTLALRASNGVSRFAPQTTSSDFSEVGPFVNELGTLGSVLATATVVLGVAALAMVYLRSLSRIDTYQLSRSSLAVAIAGDSGTGKDTLCVSLSDVFGDRATTFVMGDDYHLYDRQAPLWRVTTHLHPGANDLATMTRDAVALMRGERVRSKHYDHARGRFVRPEVVRPRELVVVNGLHSLTQAAIRDRADLSVYMSMDEGLRRRLKIERDVVERGQDLERVLESIQRRYDHAERFVQPQSALADVQIHLETVSELPSEDEVLPAQPPLRLIVTLRDSLFAGRLERALISLAHCPAHLEYLDTPGATRLIIYPEDLSSADTEALASTLIERPTELFLSPPVWHSKSIGMIQLVVVVAMLERRRSRQRSRQRR